MTENPGPSDSSRGAADEPIYSDRVDTKHVQRHRKRELEAVNKSFDGDDELSILMRAARETVAREWDSLDEYISPAKYDIVPSEDDQYHHDSPFDFRTMVCAYIYYFATPELTSWHDLESHLRASRVRDDLPDVATNLGFEEIPHHDTFRHAWNERVNGPMREHILHLVHKTVLQCRQYGIPVSDDVFPTYEGTNEPDPKEVTENEKHRALEELRPLAYDSISDFGRRDNAKYDSNLFLDLLAYISEQTEFAEKGFDQFKEYHSREGTEVPHPETVLRAIRKIPQDRMQEMFSDAMEQIITTAKSYGMFDRPVTIALDDTKIEYCPQGDAGVPDWINYTNQVRTSYMYSFVTVSAIYRGRSVKLAVFPYTPNNMKTTDAAIEVLNRAREYVKIDTVLADSGYSSYRIIDYCSNHGIDYIGRARKRNAVKERLKEFDGPLDYGKYGINYYSRKYYQTNLFSVPKQFGRPKGDTETVGDLEEEQASLGEWGGGVEPEEDEDEAEEIDFDEYITYYTNIDDLDKEKIEQLDGFYRNRWAIETAYRVIKDEFLARTTSRNFEVRVFYFRFATLLYNAWVLLNILVDARLDKPRGDRPTVTASDFGKAVHQLEYG